MIGNLRRSAIAILCFIVLCADASADQWDDLAAKLIAQEHARFIDRKDDDAGLGIYLAHPLVSKRMAILIVDGKPGLLFQFTSTKIPTDDAFELMARGGSLLFDKDTTAVMNDLREAYQAALENRDGLKGAAFDGHRLGMSASSQGYFVSCLILPADSGMNFVIDKE